MTSIDSLRSHGGRTSSTVRIAVAGCGNVGGALLDLLEDYGPAISRRTGVKFEVVSVLVRDLSRPRSTRVARERLTDSLSSFLDTPADVVVETVGGTCIASEIAHASLVRGRQLVTANKALLRVQGPALDALAREHRKLGASLEFEAAVGGGVPIVRLLRDSLGGQGLKTIRGVLNGTTNYILSRIEEGASFEQALIAAQKAGFAEADPSRDLAGLDAADKIAVLAWLGFGTDPSVLNVKVNGIGSRIEDEVRTAKAHNRVVRLVATATIISDAVYASVGPRALPADDPLSRVRNEENLIQLTSESAGTVSVSGRGAGGMATASAVLSDVLRSIRE